MTEEKPDEVAAEQSDAEIDDYWERREKLQPDMILGQLVKVVDGNPGSGIGITVTVGGSLITGELIGRRTWVEEQRGPHLGAFDGVLRAFDEMWEKQDAEDAAADETKLPTYPAFLHLKNAQVLFESTLGPQGTYWRGRLSEVQGWILGSLNGGDTDGDVP